MPRNSEVVRQWNVLRAIEQARSGGVTIDELAEQSGVTTRTIRRDLQALEEAGFPVYDDRSRDDGRTRWLLNGQAFRGLGTGLTVAELCALYFSRTLLESLAGTPFRADLESAFDKLAGVLTPHMQVFLDQLPRVIATKPNARPTETEDRQPIIARALEATFQHRQAHITYHSSSSERTKLYLVHPYRLAYAQGALYLLAFVPEYNEVRTFAIDRVQEISLLDERFEPSDDQVPNEAFPNSLGVHSGPPERVDVAFDASAAAYVRSREWHASQVLEETDGGGVRLTLNVCVDRALRSWILSFGSAARIVGPAALAAELAREHERAAVKYADATPAK